MIFLFVRRAERQQLSTRNVYRRRGVSSGEHLIVGICRSPRGGNQNR
jgi:hypothetical protein